MVALCSNSFLVGLLLGVGQFLNKLGMHCGASSVVIFVGLLDLSILLEYKGASAN